VITTSTTRTRTSHGKRGEDPSVLMAANDLVLHTKA
jgi:hypothetical protein